MKALPPDISPPMIMRLEPSSMPVAMLQISSDTLTPAELYNLAFMRIRPLLVTIPGTILPHPYGGKPMQLLVSLDQQKLLARHLTPADIHDALRRNTSCCRPATRRSRSPTGWSRRMRCRCRSRISTRSRSSEKETRSSTCATSPRCNSGPGATERGAGGRQTGRHPRRDEERRGFDPGCGRWDQEGDPAHRENRPRGCEDQVLNDASTFVKDSISDVLLEMADRLRAGGPHRVVAARLLAGHGHRLDLDPAIHSDRHHRPASGSERRSTS